MTLFTAEGLLRAYRPEMSYEPFSRPGMIISGST